jgi:hypothetical protein
VDGLRSILPQLKGMLHVKHGLEKTNVDVGNASELKDFPIYNPLRFLITTLITYLTRYPLYYLLKLTFCSIEQ